MKGKWPDLHIWSTDACFCIAPYEQFISGWPSPDFGFGREKKQSKDLSLPQGRILFWEKKSPRKANQIRSADTLRF